MSVQSISGQRAAGAVAVRRAIQSCSRCELRLEASAPIPWSGPLSPLYAVLGEAPGRTEDKESRPFVGPAGRLLHGILRDNGIDPEQTTFLNSANCYPSKSKTPTKEHVAACRVHLAGQLAAIVPTNLIVVGTVALAALIGDRMTMKKVRGRPFWLERLAPFAPFTRPVNCLPTYHPSAALRSSSYRVKIEDDIKRYARWVKDRETFPSDCYQCGKEVESWDDLGVAWCADHQGKQGVLTV